MDHETNICWQSMFLFNISLDSNMSVTVVCFTTKPKQQQQQQQLNYLTILILTQIYI